MLKNFFKAISYSFLITLLLLQPAFATLPDEDTIDFFDNNGIYYYNPAGDADECGGSATHLAGDNVAEKIWNYLIDKGFNDAQAAGVIGNGLAESGLTPTRSTTGSYWGLFQWGPRRPDLWAEMEKAGLGKYTSSEYWGAGAEENIPENDLDAIILVEMDFLMSPVDDAWVESIKEADNPELAAEIFLTRFERAVNGTQPITLYGPYLGLLYQGTNARKQFAREVYDQYAGKGVSSSTVNGSENGKNLTIIGDSITVGSTAALKEKFTDIEDAQINARVSRPWNEGLEEAKKMNLGKTVVFALGTNNSAPAITQDDVNKLLEITGNDRHIVFVTNYGVADYSKNNETFAEVAKNNANISVADWYEEVSKSPSTYLASDNIHPNSEGTKLFAELIYDAVNNNLRNGCSVGGDFEALVKAYAWPEWHAAPFTDRMPAYADAVAQSQQEGRYVGGSINGVPGIDCGGFVTILVQNSKLEPNYNTNPAGTTDRQEQWVKENGWTLLNSSPGTSVDTSILRAGDVAFTDGHTFIYVGEIPGFDSTIASASYGQAYARAPMAGKESPISNGSQAVRWYRNPNYNSRNATNTRANTAGGLIAN